MFIVSSLHSYRKSEANATRTKTRARFIADGAKSKATSFTDGAKNAATTVVAKLPKCTRPASNIPTSVARLGSPLRHSQAATPKGTINPDARPSCCSPIKRYLRQCTVPIMVMSPLTLVNEDSRAGATSADAVQKFDTSPLAAIIPLNELLIQVAAARSDQDACEENLEGVAGETPSVAADLKLESAMQVIVANVQAMYGDPDARTTARQMVVNMLPAIQQKAVQYEHRYYKRKYLAALVELLAQTPLIDGEETDLQRLKKEMVKARRSSPSPRVQEATATIVQTLDEGQSVTTSKDVKERACEVLELLISGVVRHEGLKATRQKNAKCAARPKSGKCDKVRVHMDTIEGDTGNFADAKMMKKNEARAILRDVTEPKSNIANAVDALVLSEQKPKPLGEVIRTSSGPRRRRVDWRIPELQSEVKDARIANELRGLRTQRKVAGPRVAVAKAKDVSLGARGIVERRKQEMATARSVSGA